MAFSRDNSDYNIITILPDQVKEQSTALKVDFDEAGKLQQTYNNDVLLAELEATTDGNSGMDNVGMTPINGVMTTPQQSLEYLKQRVDISNPNLNILSVLDYGADETGAVSSSTAFDDAIEAAKLAGRSVYVPYGTYLFDATVQIPSNFRLFSDGATIKTTLIQSPSNGVYPTRLFENDDTIGGNEDITIEGFVFDGDVDSATETLIDSTNTDNLLNLDNVTHLVIKNCEFTKYTSNWDTTPAALSNFAVIAIVNCEDIIFDKNRANTNRIEGPFIVSCLDVFITNFVSDNESVWTSLNLFYCERVVIENCNISEIGSGTGSLANLNVKKAFITNNFFIGGTGIDYGNETATVFTCEDVTFDNNIIISEGLNALIGDPSDGIERLTITNNYLECVGDVIRVGAALNVLIEGNDIITTLDTGNGVYLTQGAELVRVVENYINANNGVYLRPFTDDVIYKDIKVLDNKIEIFPVGVKSSEVNASGVLINAVASITGVTISGLLVDNNKINAEGNFVSTVWGAVPLLAEDFTIRNNTFFSDTGTQCARGMSLSRISNLVVDNNDEIEFVKNTFGTGIVDLEITNNRFLYPDGIQANFPIIWVLPSGHGVVTGNRAELETRALINSAHNFTTYNIKENIPQDYVCINSAFGNSTNRPAIPYDYEQYYDIQIDKPIWWDKTNWVDATGATV